MKMFAPQHENRSRERILTTARALFASNGFHQTSMAHLASAANVSVGLIYRSFKGKDDIIEAIVEADMAKSLLNFGDIQARCKAGDISVEQAFDELFEHAPDRTDEAFSFDILAEGSRNEKVRNVIGDNCAKIRMILRGFAKAANPKLSEHRLDGAEEIILACLFGLKHSSLSRPKLDAGNASRQAAAMIVAALRCLE